MSYPPGVKRGFNLDQDGDSWCVNCIGSKCRENVGFLYDDKGKVQGYIIDSEVLREVVYKRYPGENRRLSDFPPTDGIYKRPLDVKKLISKNPSNVNTVRFSNDLLKRLLVGVEGCDNFLRGTRRISHESFSKGKEHISIDSTLKDHEEEGAETVVSERVRTESIIAEDNSFDEPKDDINETDEIFEHEAPEEERKKIDYIYRTGDGCGKNKIRVYAVLFIFAGLAAGAFFFAGLDTVKEDVEMQGVTIPDAAPEVTSGESRQDERETGIMPPKDSFHGKSVYSLQVGAFSVMENAESLSEILISKGYKVNIMKQKMSDGTFLNMVLVGRFQKREDALKESRSLLQREGIRSFVARN